MKIFIYRVATGITGAAGISPRTQYLQKRRQLFQLGGRGSEPGCFTWPRGIAVGPDNSIVVADSSNHRLVSLIKTYKILIYKIFIIM